MLVSYLYFSLLHPLHPDFRDAIHLVIARIYREAARLSIGLFVSDRS